MARGKKIDLDIGAHIDTGWSQVETVESEITTPTLLPQQHALVFQRQKRRGKVVTLIGPFHIDKTQAHLLLKKVKKMLGCGGSYKAPWMEFQGERHISLKPLLTAEGFAFKR